MTEIKKVAVLGAGLMGSGIAAQIANAGYPVILLDIVPKDAGEDRSKLARGAIEKMKQAKPPVFMGRNSHKNITPANLEDDLEQLKTCDWVVEVVLEDLDIKHQTYKKIAPHLKKGAIISSNTSTIPLEMLVEPMEQDFKDNFVITHFFNPPRYMRLLELVSAPNTNKVAVEAVRDFCDVQLGKGVVVCNDTPGFIANRLGVFWLTTALNTAIEQGIPVEAADAVMSKPVGIPKTGVFGLLDLIGIDLMPHLSKSLLSTLPDKDAYRDSFVDHAFLHSMIQDGFTGRKGKGGFYRLDTSEGKKEKQALSLHPDNFDLGQYSPAQKIDLESIKAGKQGLKAVLETDDKGGRFAKTVLLQTLAYAASLVGEIADTVADIDEAMRLGYNWKQGPFEMIDALGADWFSSELKEAGIDIPDIMEKLDGQSFYKVKNGKPHYFGTYGKYHPVERAKGVLLLSDIKLASQPLIKTNSASAWDIGEGIVCFEFTGKMNALDEPVFDAYHQVIDLIGNGKGKYKGLVVYNEGAHFSAGANLAMAIEAMKAGRFEDVARLVKGGQDAYMALKFAPFPVVAAPFGMALGGGCEILLHVDHVQAHAETYAGLVEVGVGLIPGWGGCKEMLLRYQAREAGAYDKHTGGKKIWFSPKTTPMGAIREAFQTIGTAKVSTSGENARELGYFKPTDKVTMNRDRLLFDARAKAIELAKDYTAPEQVTSIRLPGKTAKAALDMSVQDLKIAGKATPYDVVVSGHLSYVLSGGDDADMTREISEQDILDLEFQEFMKLVREGGTHDRIEHMLTKGKPLRN